MSIFVLCRTNLLKTGTSDSSSPPAATCLHEAALQDLCAAAEAASADAAATAARCAAVLESLRPSFFFVSDDRGGAARDAGAERLTADALLQQCSARLSRCAAARPTCVCLMDLGVPLNPKQCISVTKQQPPHSSPQHEQL